MNAKPESIRPAEHARLHAFAVRVGCYAGHRYPERPQWVEIEDKRLQVASVDSEWREEERLGYLVTLSDGRRLLLCYAPSDDLWSGVPLA